MTKVVCHKPSNKLDNILFITQFYLVLKLKNSINTILVLTQSIGKTCTNSSECSPPTITTKWLAHMDDWTRKLWAWRFCLKWCLHYFLSNFILIRLSWSQPGLWQEKKLGFCLPFASFVHNKIIHTRHKVKTNIPARIIECLLWSAHFHVVFIYDRTLKN
jgi:hypothetical protein